MWFTSKFPKVSFDQLHNLSVFCIWCGMSNISNAALAIQNERLNE